MIRRRWAAAAIATALAAGAGLAGCGSPSNVGAPGPDGYVRNLVPVALSELDGPVADGARLAIKEVNATGGVLGLPLRLVEGMGPRAVVAFGCPAGGTMAAVYYCPGDGGASSTTPGGTPSTTSGGASSTTPGGTPSTRGGGPRSTSGGGEPGVFFTGSAPNQRVVPALEYLVSQGRTSLYLAVGDDPFSRATAAIVRAYATTGAVTVVGQISVADLAPAAADPSRAAAGLSRAVASLSRAATVRPRATAVLSTLDPAGTTRFLTAYGRTGLRPDRVPMLSLSLTEADLPAVPDLAGQLLGGSYFQSLPSRANEAFVTAIRREFAATAAGEPTAAAPTTTAVPATTAPTATAPTATAPTATEFPSEPVESAYLAVYVWRAMVAKAGSFRPEEVLARDGLVIDAPEGRVMVDAPRGHLYRTARVGRVGADGVVRTVWESAPVRADPELLAYPWAAAAGVR